MVLLFTMAVIDDEASQPDWVQIMESEQQKTPGKPWEWPWASLTGQGSSPETLLTF